MVGAGIVGACIAYALVKRGKRVLLIDADEPGRGCSYGNSGAISAGSIAPVAMPGIFSSLPRLLFDRDGPLRIDPWFVPRALPWLLRFLATATPARVEHAARVLHALHVGVIEAHVALAAEIGAPELIVRRGHLHVYPDEKSLASDRMAWDLRARFRVRFERLDRDGIETLEPRIGARYRIGMYLPDHATVVNPHRYVTRIVAAFVARGGELARDRVRLVRDRSGIVCVGSSRHRARHVIVAAGIGSRALLQAVGVRVPLLSQRGYHVTFPDAPAPVSRTVVLADRKAFVTPMEDGLRIGGTVEIAAESSAPDPRRTAQLARFARETFGELGGREEPWMGNRPCTPDSLPVIGASKRDPSLWLAIGHGHLGLTQSVATARLICDGIG